MNADRMAIVTAARLWIGTKYQHQASLRQVGCDCLGLLRGVWRDIVGPEPEAIPLYSTAWMSITAEELLLTGLERHFQRVATDAFLAGDVLIFRFGRHWPASHIGIAASPTSMIHAHCGACVAEVDIGDHWRRRLAAVLSFPGLNN